MGDWYIRSERRAAGDAQRAALRERYGTANPRLLAALALMEEHVEEPIGGDRLAREAGVSRRQLERLARDQLGATLGEAYMRIRLARAMALMRETALPTIAVAAACGFTSASHFSRSFRRRYGIPPTQAR